MNEKRAAETDAGEKADMILRDHLAVDRTKLANQRTILPCARTAIMLLGSGVTLIKLVESDSLLWAVGIALVPVSLLVAAVGIVSYVRMNRKMKGLYR